MEVFSYNENDKIKFSLNEGDFCTILGEGNKRIINNLYYLNKNDFVKLNYMSFKNFDKTKIGTRINFVLNDTVDLFICTKVKDEINFLLENKGLSPLKITELISEYTFKFKLRDVLEDDPSTIGSTKQILLKFVIAFLCEPKVLVLDNIFENLDLLEKEFIIEELKKYVKKGNVVINFTSNIEEAIIGNKLILTSKTQLLAEGKTLSVLNEERLLKRLGLGEPFIIELCKRLMDYNLIDKYYYDYKKLVDNIWK